MIVIGSTRNDSNNNNSNSNSNSTNNSNGNSNSNSNTNNSNSNKCSFQISYFLRCVFPAPPPKLSFFTGIQPLNFLVRNALIKEPGVFKPNINSIDNINNIGPELQDPSQMQRSR